MSGQDNKYCELSSLVEAGKIDDALKMAADHFRQVQKYDELFEIEKCRIRHELGLAIDSSVNSSELDINTQRQLEDSMLELCREIGSAHCRSGNISRGWMYLQPLMDQDFVESLFDKVKVTEENIEQLIEIGLGQWAAPVTGYRLLIQTRGTCNAITFFDTQIVFQEAKLRSELASVLVDHVYTELLSNIKAWLSTNMSHTDQLNSDDSSIQDLISGYPQLFDNCGHHLDVSHLASIVRIARLCNDVPSLDQARQLADYGCHLDAQLKYSGDPPFEELFEAHRHYFDARLGRDVETCIEYFRSIYQQSKDPRAAETLIELHRSSGDSSLAIAVAIENGDETEAPAGIELVELSETISDFDRIKQHFRNQDDLASFCIASVAQSRQQKKPDR